MAVEAGVELAALLGGSIADWLSEDPAVRAARLRYMKRAAGQFADASEGGEDGMVECVNLFDPGECSPAPGDRVWRTDDGMSVAENTVPGGDSKWRANGPEEGPAPSGDRWKDVDLNAPNCSASPDAMTSLERERWRAYCGVEAEPEAAAPSRGWASSVGDADPTAAPGGSGDYLALPSVGEAVRGGIGSLNAVWDDDVASWVADQLPDGALRNTVMGITDVRAMSGEVIETIERGAAVDISLGEPGDEIPFRVRPTGTTPEGKRMFGVFGLIEGAADRTMRQLGSVSDHLNAAYEGRDIPVCNPWGDTSTETWFSFWTNTDVRRCP